MEGIFVPISMFAMIAAIVILPGYLRSRERKEMQQTVRAAIEKGQPLPTELIEAMSKDVKVAKVSSSLRDLRIGVIMIFTGLGLAGFGYAFSFTADEAFYPFLGIGAVPASIGLAHHQGLGLGQHIGQQQLVVVFQSVHGFFYCYKLHRYYVGALVQHLKIRVLAVGAGFAP